MSKTKTHRHSDKILGEELDYKKYGEGFDASSATIECDSRFTKGLGTGISRRTLLKASAAVSALGGMGQLSTAFAQKDKKFDPVVKIGYIRLLTRPPCWWLMKWAFSRMLGLNPLLLH